MNMTTSRLSDFPDESRIWIFEANEPLGDESRTALADELDEFMKIWAAHGSKLAAGWEFNHGRFLVIAVDQSAAGASGCSIDALTRFVTSVGEKLGVSFFDRDAVTYRDGDDVKRVTRAEFARLARNGMVSGETPVFDNTVSTLGAVRDGRWETEAGRSWQASLLA